MKYAFAEITINPQQPCQTAGFFVKKPDATYTKDALFARALRLCGGDDVVIITLDSLGVTQELTKQLTAAVAAELEGSPRIVITSSHTHFAPALSRLFGIVSEDKAYYQYVEERLRELARSLVMREVALWAGYAREPFNAVGSTRISNKDDSNVYAGALSLFDGDKRLGSLLFYNCHPTISAEDADFFTADYPGRAIKTLHDSGDDGFLMFLQGADGDVSTRFTRREKSYAEVERLGDLLATEFASLIKRVVPMPVESVGVAEKTLTVLNRLKKLPELTDEQAQAAMAPKEYREYLQGKAFLAMMSRVPIPETAEAVFTRVSLGNLRLVFNPYELFSDYNGLIDKDETLLAGYSNGLACYLSQPDNTNVSYETFMEFPTEADKRNILEVLQTL